ncbi:MAG: 4-(cytidine 5'-diphospho)-2-C-methyl-D-erythritol kinase, partial [Clostridium sp.]
MNIALDVIGKREDGYHLLRMIMQTVNIYDELEFEKGEQGIKIT